MKTLKTLSLLMLLLTAFTNNVNAQDSTQTDDCAKYRSLYYQYLSQGMYRDAANFWTKAYVSCTAQNEPLDAKFYKNGRVAYLQLLQLEKKNEPVNEEVVQGLNDTIAWIYEKKMAIEDDKEWTSDYANFLMGNKDPRTNMIDSLYKDAVHSLQCEASYTAIRLYFTHLIINEFNKAPAEEKEDVRGMVIEEYVALSDYTTCALKKFKEAGEEQQVKGYENAQAFMDKYFLQVAKDCEALVPVMEKKFNELPEDMEPRKVEVSKYLKLLDQKSCQETPIYSKYLDEKLRIDPTADGYFFKGSLLMKQDKFSEAAKAFEKAVELEGAGENKDKYTYYLASAQYSSRNYSAAFSTAKSVGGEYKGDALVICANVIAARANDCGDTTFERKSNFWLANDYIQKAIAAGAKNVSSSKFLDSAPNDDEKFTEGVSNGQSVTLKCWGETTTDRKSVV